MSPPASLSSPAPAPGAALTAEELLHLPGDGWRYALVEGELQRMTPAGFDHGAVVMNVAVPLGQHVRRRGLGVVCPGAGGRDRRRLDDSILHAIVIRQEDPRNDNSSVYMVFERLNTTSTALSPQECSRPASSKKIEGYGSLHNNLEDKPGWSCRPRPCC